MNNLFSITMGIPEHGWLSVDLLSEDYILNIDASDVPVNPLEQLCDVILNLEIDNKGEVYWHLEPALVFFEFKKLDKNYHLIITTAAEYESARKMEKRFSGNFQEIILPFIKALTLFYSRTYSEQHWPAIEIKKINRLQQLA
jgi:hypothetical protein